MAITWSTYNLLRKKINVQTDIGLFIETIFFVPVALILFYFISQKGLNDFSLSNPNIMFWLFLAGPMTVIPLYLYLRGVELAGLGTSGMVFFMHMILMDSENQLAMNLGETYLVTEKGNERLGKQKLDLIVL